MSDMLCVSRPHPHGAELGAQVLQIQVIHAPRQVADMHLARVGLEVAGTAVEYEQTVRRRAARPGKRMRRVCTGARVHW